MDILGFLLLIVTFPSLWGLGRVLPHAPGVAGLSLLLGLAILLRHLGGRWVNFLMPARRLRSWCLGMVGGFIGSVLGKAFLTWGPELAGVHLLGAVLGEAMVLLAWGLYPFLRISLKAKLR